MVYDPKKLRVEFDASPWGGAAILFVENEASEFFVTTWSKISHLRVIPGKSDFQTFWEFLTLCLAMRRWCPLYDGVLFCGDNLASLNLALGLKGNGVEGAVARELAWRSARYRWSYAVAHLPAEGNKVADRMSRILDPSLPKLLELPSALIGAAEVSVCVESLWSFP